MAKHKQKSVELKAERQAIYDFFEKKGFIEAIKRYSSKHNEILISHVISQMNHLQDALTRKKK